MAGGFPPWLMALMQGGQMPPGAPAITGTQSTAALGAGASAGMPWLMPAMIGLGALGGSK